MSFEVDFAAACTPQQAEALLPFDHHRVRIADRWAVLLTYHWHPFEEHPEPYIAYFVTRYTMPHPEAPPEIQSIIDLLTISLHKRVS